jgi:hypothetical protein
MEEFGGVRYYDLLFLCILFRGMNKIDDAQTVLFSCQRSYCSLEFNEEISMELIEVFLSSFFLFFPSKQVSSVNCDSKSNSNHKNNSQKLL